MAFAMRVQRAGIFLFKWVDISCPKCIIINSTDDTEYYGSRTVKCGGREGGMRCEYDPASGSAACVRADRGVL